MTDLPPPCQPSPRARHPLNYAAPEPEPPAGGIGTIGQIALGATAFVGTVLVGTLIAMIIPQPIGGVAGPLVALIALVWVSIIARASWHWKAFLLGVPIGLGLTLLAVGLCFVVAMSNFHG